MIHRCIVLSIVVWTSARIYIASIDQAARDELQGDLQTDVRFLRLSADTIRTIRAHRFEAQP